MEDQLNGERGKIEELDIFELQSKIPKDLNDTFAIVELIDGLTQTEFDIIGFEGMESTLKLLLGRNVQSIVHRTIVLRTDILEGALTAAKHDLAKFKKSFEVRDFRYI